MPMYEMISEIIQEFNPEMSVIEADEQALQIFYESDEYIQCLDLMLNEDSFEIDL